MKYEDIINNKDIKEIAIETAQKLKEFVGIASREEILVSSILIEDAFKMHLSYDMYMDRQELREELFPLNEVTETLKQVEPPMGRTERCIRGLHSFIFGNCTSRDFNVAIIISILLGISIAETLVLIQ